MESLILYKNLSLQENKLLEDFLIYRDIYQNANHRNVNVNDDEAIELKGIILNFYYDFSSTISLAETIDFISKNYLDDNITMEELKEASKSVMENAVENNDINIAINRNTQFIRDSKVAFVSDDYDISKIEENQIYAYDVSEDFYADYFLVKKIKDKIITSFAWTDDNNKLRLSEVNDETELDYNIVNYKDFKNDNFKYFYNKIQTLYEKYNCVDKEELEVYFNSFISELKINQIDSYELKEYLEEKEKGIEYNAR